MPDGTVSPLAIVVRYVNGRPGRLVMVLVELNSMSAAVIR